MEEVVSTFLEFLFFGIYFEKVEGCTVQHRLPSVQVPGLRGNYSVIVTGLGPDLIPFLGHAMW